MERQYWITSANPKNYRVFEAYNALPEIDWRLSANPEVGDIVYIYISGDYQFVKYKTLVVASGIKLEDTIDDKEFVTTKGKKELTKVESFTRLRLLETFRDNSIPAFELIMRGVTNNFRNTQRLSQKCIEYLKICDSASNFSKGCFAYLIDQYSKEMASSLKPKSKSKTYSGKAIAENIRQILPFLIKCANLGWTHQSYFELLKVCANLKEFVPIEIVMEVIHNVISTLSKETRQDIPTLNALLTDLFTGLPKHKFDYVLQGYDNLSDEDKQKVVDAYQVKAIDYKNWDWVLNILGLGHPVDNDLIERIHKNTYGTQGGEEEQQKIKDSIAENPMDFIIYSHVKGVKDYILLSGDHVDVYFPDVNSAVEVIPSTASEEEIMRGIYQCVRNKALLEAESKYKGEFINPEVILGLGGFLNKKMREVAENLDVRVMEGLSLDDEEFEELW